MSSSRQLLVWLKRSAPARSQLLRSFTLGALGALANAGLLIGAIGLLVESAKRPGLAAVAVVLIIIEIFAFLRSPLRYVERTSSHRLGFAAVQRWRRWLLLTIGSWNFSRWRSYASGDLLERSLVDTDELQGLWLRGALPLFQAVLVLVAGDVVIALLPASKNLLGVVGILVALQALTVAVLLRELSPLVKLDALRRHAKARLSAVLVDYSRIGPELRLLGQEELLTRRLHQASDHLEQSERDVERRWNRVQLTGPISALCSVLLVVPSAHTSRLWLVVIALICLTNLDCYTQVTGCLESTVLVMAAVSRLESLESTSYHGSQPWPTDTTLELLDVRLEETGRVLLESGTLRVSPGEHLGITGISGAGKSSLLRVMSGLQSPQSGKVLVGGTPLTDISEESLREHVSYVPSSPGLLRGYVRDVVTMGRNVTVDYISLLSELGIEATPDLFLGGLSTGQAARVAFARALATAPGIVILDEPTAGLGEAETQRVLSTLTSSGATVVVVSHDPAVLQWCDRVVVLATAELH